MGRADPDTRRPSGRGWKVSRRKAVGPARPDLPLDHLDQGVWLPGYEPREKPEPKTKEELAQIRAKAWATRRASRTGGNK
jgi:hypothetical protein